MHYITKCSCGVILAQCRCNGNKVLNIIQKGCEKCHLKTLDFTQVDRTHWMIKKGNVILQLSIEELECLKNELQELFHEDN